jgi:hypothetical protein
MNSKTNYCIVYRRHYYAGTFYANHNWQILDNSFYDIEDARGASNDGISFNSKENAKSYLENYDKGTYYLGHGEHSRPTYKIVNSNHSIVVGALNRLKY